MQRITHYGCNFGKGVAGEQLCFTGAPLQPDEQTAKSLCTRAEQPGHCAPTNVWRRSTWAWKTCRKHKLCIMGSMASFSSSGATEGKGCPVEGMGERSFVRIECSKAAVLRTDDLARHAGGEQRLTFSSKALAQVLGREVA
jgi:hypothetical protein